jgi:cob(I)alamin adenosyltransferase
MIAQLETPTIHSPCQPPYMVEGLVQVFTCSRRSFLTSVMAQALRVSGQGTPVLIVQFLKGGINQGHERPVRLGQNLDWIRCNLPRCVDTPQLDELENRSLQELWQHTRQAVSEGQYSLVLLDELSVAVEFGLIPLAEVLDFIQQRPTHVDVILTGSNMPQALLDLADQITEVRRSHQL